MSSPAVKSQRCGLWRWFLLRRLAPIAALGLLVVLGYVSFWRHHLKRFHAVRAGALYRVAQPTEFGLRHLQAAHGVKTVLSVRLEDPVLYRGLLDPGEPDGQLESAYSPQVGLRHLQWPMGEETYWPWLTPWQYEEFYKLFDEPGNLPVVVHCLGGRHRTGTISALFDLEYNRRSVEQVLAEMYSFAFGDAAWLQEHNLRTYLPRPRPDAKQWTALLAGLTLPAEAPAPKDYESLVRQLRALDGNGHVRASVHEYLLRGRPFALCLAQRLIDTPDHPLADLAARRAHDQLQAVHGDATSWAAAAALVADFGSTDQQRALYELIEREPKDGLSTPRYAAVVRGVTGRYTPNRIAYLLPLLDDARPRPEPEARGYRYCDTAVARLTSIVNEPLFLERQPMLAAWNDGVNAARRWFDDHPHGRQLVRLQPPSGKNVVRAEPAGERDGRNWVR